MSVRIKGHIAYLADAQGIVGRKLVQEVLRRSHSRCVPRHTAEIGVHRVGDVHDDDHRHVRLLANLTHLHGGLHLEGDVKHIFQVCPGNGLAH